MKKRFEIPLTEGDGLSEINLFAVDDFLRDMASSEARKRLIFTAGGSPETRARYEKKHGLPHGSVEMVMMLEDKRMRELDKLIMSRIPTLIDKSTRPEVMEEIYRHAFSMARGMQQLYPDASDFMLQYAVLTQRNRQRFMGDYGFSNEYKLQLVDCFLSCDSGLNCNANINITVNVNLGLNVNVAAINKVALALVFVVCIALPVWPALYGPPMTMS